MSTEPIDLDAIRACVMTHTEPFDFAQCETHDTTFPLGEACKFQGREPWQVYFDEADEQRQRAVMAEAQRDALAAQVEAVRNILSSDYGSITRAELTTALSTDAALTTEAQR